MLDTNVFNALCDGNQKIFTFIDGKETFVTSAQIAELEKASEPRRTMLILRVREMDPGKKSLKSAVWGYFKWGDDGVAWGADGGHYEHLLLKLDEIKRGDRGNINDALIAEACLVERLTLVTCDQGLATAMNHFRTGSAINFAYS